MCNQGQAPFRRRLLLIKNKLFIIFFFLDKGCEYRIAINQILQSPSIYYWSELDRNGISVYTRTIISDWGGRLELEIDWKARIWACVSRKQKNIYSNSIISYGFKSERNSRECLLFHNDTMSALGRTQDMFSDTAIQLQPVFTQWIQNTHALVPAATAPKRKWSRVE